MNTVSLERQAVASCQYWSAMSDFLCGCLRHYLDRTFKCISLMLHSGCFGFDDSRCALLFQPHYNGQGTMTAALMQATKGL